MDEGTEMKKTAQIVLVSISILFSSFQALFFHEYHLSEIADFIVATTIAWFVGWQYDKLKHYAKQKKESEDCYKQLIDWLPNPIIIQKDEVIIYVNKAAFNMVGATSKYEVINKPVYEFISPDYKDRLAERIKQIYKERKPLPSIEQKVRRLDGKMIIFEASSVLLPYEDENIILTIGNDITDRKEQTDSLLQKSEKLALVGQMAAGIAHEIRNPLTSIKGFIQLFRSNTDQKDYYDIVLTELERINDILGEFLILAKPSVVVFKENDLRTLIKDVVTLVSTQSILNNVQIFVECDTILPKISCEENQLKQVFINIIKNAIEAMPNGGIIKIRIHEKAEGLLSIFFIDEGVGIPKDRIPTLGEPFYTTKEKGTGLGLMTCFRIIENHHGKLHITSEMNKGTTIEIILPTITQPYLNTLSS